MKKLQIENEHLLIEVQVTGGEICRIYSKTTQLDYMWDANPAVWGSFAPVLFPIVGRVKNFKYRHNGSEYTIPQHGIFRKNTNCVLRSRSDNHITIGLSSSEETMISYPFAFNFEITYRLDGQQIYVEHKVVNDGLDNMYFSLGAHPGFKCPLHDNENYDDYYLEFEKEETLDRWMVTPEGTIAEHPKPYLNKTKCIPLHKDLFNEDAIVFKNQVSNSIHLKSKKSAQILSVHFESFSYLGLWTKPQANFICIEPWLGIADTENFIGELKDKEGILALEKKATYSVAYSIEVND